MKEKYYLVNKDENNYIIIDKDLVHGKNICWKNSINTHIIGKYKAKYFDFEVLEYSPKNEISRLR